LYNIDIMLEGGDQSFLAQLLAKLSFTKQVEAQTGKPTTAAQQEVWRQIGQTSPKKAVIQ